MQALNAADSAERDGKAIARRSGAMSLPRKDGASAQAGGGQEARALGGEAQELLAQVELPDIVIALMPVCILAVLTCAGGVVAGEGQLGSDLLEGVLRLGKAELVTKESGFGGAAV